MEVTGFIFHTTQKGKPMVGYSTRTSQGRFVSWHDRTGLTDEQARGKFHIEHEAEVKHLLSMKGQEDARIIHSQ